MRWLVIALTLIATAPFKAAAQNKNQEIVHGQSANFLMRVFSNACVNTHWRPAQIRAWAESNRLPVISDPAALAVFVGEGGNGQAWGIPAPFGSFALSIRGKTQACTAWARTADAREMEKLFRILVEGTRRAGLDPTIDHDNVITSADGPKHVLSYTLFPSGKTIGAYAIMQATARPEGGSLVSLEIVGAEREEPSAK